VFRGSDAIAAGRVTRGLLRSTRYVRLFPDVYAPAGVDLDLGLRSRAAYALVSRRGGILAGHSAAELLGAGCAPPGAPAEVLVDHDVRPHPGLLVHRAAVSPDDVVLVRGCRVTSPERTAWDLARRPGLTDSVVAVDTLAARWAFDPSVLLGRRRPRVRGGRRVEHVVALADRRSESPMESRLRLLLVLGGLPQPVVQHLLRDRSGVAVARFDLAYPHARLAIEYDGGTHLEAKGRIRDRERDAAASRLGWMTLRFGPKDVLAEPTRTLRTVTDVLRSRQFDTTVRIS
jgi:very-short-patch-repair endonuclease